MRLHFCHQVTEERNFGKERVSQTMIVSVDYDPREDSISDETVEVFQNGKYIADITKLLEEAEGNPLSAMLEGVDWRALYMGKVEAGTPDEFEIEKF